MGDKWGWSVCKQNYLMVGMRRDGLGNALYNLAYGVCAKLAEEGTQFGTQTVNSGTCYHENWWKRFDYKGGKFCRRGFFVAGLFRSHCNSLYCIEMAKCCQVKRSLWNTCRWKQISKGGRVALPSGQILHPKRQGHTLCRRSWRPNLPWPLLGCSLLASTVPRTTLWMGSPTAASASHFSTAKLSGKCIVEIDLQCSSAVFMYRNGRWWWPTVVRLE